MFRCAIQGSMCASLAKTWNSVTCKSNVVLKIKLNSSPDINQSSSSMLYYYNAMIYEWTVTVIIFLFKSYSGLSYEVQCI